MFKHLRAKLAQCSLGGRSSTPQSSKKWLTMAEEVGIVLIAKANEPHLILPKPDSYTVGYVKDRGHTMNIEKLLARITINPVVSHGKPCIRNLRYPVEIFLELLSGGMSIEEILDDYEDLEREDILAVLAFAARMSQVKRVEAVLV